MVSAMRKLLGMTVMFLAAACGSDGNYPFGESAPPTITNLRLIPDSAIADRFGVDVAAVAEFDYVDDHENAVLIVLVRVTDDEGNRYETRSFPDTPVAPSGTLQGNFSINISRVQMYSVEVAISDENLIWSNALQADFVVHAP
jgi:hypothetical protein